MEAVAGSHPLKIGQVRRSRRFSKAEKTESFLSLHGSGRMIGRNEVKLSLNSVQSQQNVQIAHYYSGNNKLQGNPCNGLVILNEA
jgi:hypothetical protein